ncbi:MAG: serine/threonine protein kinase [Gemmataceae bacterium]
MSTPLSKSMDQLLDRFDDAWNGPTLPRIEDYLPPADSPDYPPMLEELVKIELERRFKRGERPALAEYRQRFPACAEAAWLDEARAAAEKAAAPNKETDDPRISPTLDGPPMPPSLGRSSRLVGEYELLERIPGGGMGEVYKARHRRLDKLVALKLLPADAQHPREMAARFQREMKAVGSLDHPNVVEAHDAGEQSGVVYLAMKLIDGVDLERLVKERGPLPIDEACELVRQSALGLHYLHQRGLVHRDVKPSNLMRTPDGTVKVLDLGLARWRLEAEAGHGLTGMGRVMGTPDFLAPEQIENAADADARADLYGLGGTLFYLLTGRAPFADHKSWFSKLDAHRMEPPPDVQKLRPDVPAELAALLQRLLAKKPEERFATADEVAAALAPFASAPQPRSEPVKRPRAKRRTQFIALAGGMALLGILVLIVAIGWPHPQQTIRLTVDVLHRPAPDRFLRPGKLGEEAFDTRFGDSVTVTARLSPPAYAFLIAFRPDGVVEVIFPDKEDQGPQRKASMEADYELNDGAGLEAFATVVSSQPLPSFKEWWKSCPRCPWNKFPLEPGIGWRADGVEEPVPFYEHDRGKSLGTTGRQAVKELAEWLRGTPGIETVQVLGFTVLPNAKR